MELSLREKQMLDLITRIKYISEASLHTGVFREDMQIVNEIASSGLIDLKRRFEKHQKDVE